MDSLFEKHCNQRLNYAFIYKINKYIRIDDILIKILKIWYHTIKVSFYKACVNDERNYYGTCPYGPQVLILY